MSYYGSSFSDPPPPPPPARVTSNATASASASASSSTSSSNPTTNSSPSNPTSTPGGNQFSKAGGAGPNNHILLAMLVVSTVVIAIFTIVTMWRFLKKHKKKTGEAVIPTSNGTGNKMLEDELPLRYFGESYAKAQSPVHAINIADHPPQVVAGDTIEGFFQKFENTKPTKFSSQQLATITRDFSTKLGSGGFGDVYKGELADGTLVAVKRLKDNKPSKKIQAQFMAEVGTIGTTNHINLVTLQGYCIEPTMAALVYEYMANGSLDKFLFGRNGQLAIEWQKLHEIAIGTARGIAYLHEECQPRIIHYDIKPENILIDAKMLPKVADFGLAKMCSIGESHVTLACGRGTRGYAAPELWTLSPVTYQCDVYSFGIVLFEMVWRRRNHDGSTEPLSSLTWEMYKKKGLNELKLVCGIEEKEWGKAERMLMVGLWCIQYNAERRPKMSNVVKMLEGVMDIPTPTYPFQHTEQQPYDGVESVYGSKDCSIPISRLRKSKTFINRSVTSIDL